MDVARPHRAQLHLIELDDARGIELVEVVVDPPALCGDRFGRNRIGTWHWLPPSLCCARKLSKKGPRRKGPRVRGSEGSSEIARCSLEPLDPWTLGPFRLEPLDPSSQYASGWEAFSDWQR